MYILTSIILLLFLLELGCSQCSKGLYHSDNGCKPCHNDCATCYNHYTCDSCRDGYYFKFESKFCFSCEVGCRTCYNSKECKSCIDGYYLSSGKCSKCSNNCQTSNDNCKCDTCIEGYYLNNNQCLQCNLNCKTCQVSANNCSSCYEGYHLNDNKTCEKNIISTTEKLSKNILINTNNIINKTSNYTIVNSNICDVIEFFVGKCKNNFENKEDKDTFKDNILSAIKDGSLRNLISSKTRNNSYLIADDSNDIYLISTLENQMNLENVTSIT